jgi:hypothetical protein
MDELTITQNDDGTLAFIGELADPVACSAELWNMLMLSDQVLMTDTDPAGDPITPTIMVTTDRYWLSYAVLSQTDEQYVLMLGSWSERPTPTGPDDTTDSAG